VAETGTALNATAGAGRCGAASLWLALAAFLSAVSGIVILAVVPMPMSSQAWEVINIVAVVLFVAAAPLGHMVGAGFGIAALVRPNDRVKFGVIGLLINAGAAVVLIGSMVVAWKTIGFR
jgi:hypothetical protein